MLHLTIQIAHNVIHAKEHDMEICEQNCCVTSHPNEYHKGAMYQFVL